MYFYQKHPQRRVTRYFVLYVCFVDHCFSFVHFPLIIVLSVLLLYRMLIIPLVSLNSSYKGRYHLRYTKHDIFNGNVVIVQEYIS
jgi:ABC-type transport system involved in cytochrome bd biosynthesis fused ATPase/permease subunit